MAMKDWVKVAVGQIFIAINQEKRNLEKILKFVDQAAANQADLIAFPECANNGYVYRGVDHAFENATPIPGPFTEELTAKAKEKKIYIAVGLSERGEYPEVYNTGILINSQGTLVGKYQKHFLVTADKLWFKSSKTGFPVFPTELGTLGIFICADGRIFENARCLALGGADILLDLTNWFHPVQANINTPARAIENGVWVVAANKVGYECSIEDSGTTQAIGSSFIMSPKGEFVARASHDLEEIIYGMVRPAEAREKKLGRLNHLFRDRRPETYSTLIQPTKNLPISSIVKEPLIPELFSIQTVILQTHSEKANVKENLDPIVSRIERASALLSNFILLPEFQFGEAFTKNKALKTLAETVPGPITDIFANIAREYRNYIVGTLLENEDGQFYKTAFLIGPEGYMGKYRKMHLWEEERSYLQPGNLGYPIFKTNFGNIGMMIGYDGFFPEVARVMNLHGADLIAWPALWDREAYPTILCPARSVDNRVFIAAATPVGDGLVGQSMITDPNGTILSKGEKDQEQYVRGKLDLYHSRNKKIFVNASVVFDREPENYHILGAI